MTQGGATPHLVEVIGAVVERFGDRLLVEPTADLEGLTYAGAWRWADQAAAGLMRVGAGPGDRLVVRAPKSIESLIAYLACLKVGAIWTPVAPGATSAEFGHVIGDAEPRVVLDGHRSVCDVVGGAPAGPDGSLDPPQPAGTTPGPERIAAMLYTSGTTGRPKGVPISGGALAANAAALVDAWGFTERDVLVHALPTHHAHGLFVALGCALTTGASMRWFDRFDATTVVEALPGASAFMGVPTHYVRLLGQPRFNRAACRTMRLLTSGSAPLSAVGFRRIADRTGIEVVERYGMTETLMLTSNPLAGPRKPGSVGLPLPGVELRLGALDGVAPAEADDTPVDDAGPVGMVEVRGAAVFEHYWGRTAAPADWARPDRPGEPAWFRTGDLGRLDSDGYLHLVGRAKDLIISGGLNVYPAEVEAVLERHPDVEEVAVIGLSDDQWGQRVTAVAVRSATMDTGTSDAELAERLVDAARSDLSAYKVPRRVHVVDSLPRNTMGKVDKAELRRTFGGG